RLLLQPPHALTTSRVTVMLADAPSVDRMAVKRYDRAVPTRNLAVRDRTTTCHCEPAGASGTSWYVPSYSWYCRMTESCAGSSPVTVTEKVTPLVFSHWPRSAQVRLPVTLATVIGLRSMVAAVIAGGLATATCSDSVYSAL